MEIQIEERKESLDTFLDGIEISQEAGENLKTGELLAELNNTIGVSIKLTSDQQKALKENPKLSADEIRDVMVSDIQNSTVARLLNTIEMRIGEPLDIRADDLNAEFWGELTNELLNASQQAFNQRIDKMVGDNGLITKDLDNLLLKLTPPYSDHEIIWLLLQIPQGSRALFDRKTHRRIIQRTNRINYVYYAAFFLEDLRTNEISERVLEHLEGALNAILIAWGRSEINRLAGATLFDLEEKTRHEVFQELELKSRSSNYGDNDLKPGCRSSQ